MPGNKYPIYPDIAFDPTIDRIMSLTTPLDFTPGQTRELLIEIPDNFVRLIEQQAYFLNGFLDMSVIEGITATAGTPNFAGCVDRNMNAPSVVTCSVDPTGASGGFALTGFPHFAITNDISNYDVSETQAVNFVTFKLNTKYLFRFVNNSTESITNMHYLLVWAERS